MRTGWRSSRSVVASACAGSRGLLRITAMTRSGPHWHDERRERMLREHPALRSLTGPNRWTAVLIIVLAALQLSIGAVLARFPWWAAVIGALLVGTLVSHALGVLIHEATHDLVFTSPTANRIIAMVANIPLVFPAAMDFRGKHLKHHAHLGQPDGADTQAPQTWDFRFVTNGVRRFVWHAMGPILTHSDAPAQRPSLWLYVNVALNAAAMLAYTWAFGLQALLFLGISGVMAFGHHPVGVRRYGEHLTLREGQPTVSYYGPLNWVSFDVGLHVEHHDLPNVPWNHLRAVRSIAAPEYESLAALHSWSALLWQLTMKRGEGPARYFLERKPSRRGSG